MIVLRLTREVMTTDCCRGALQILEADGEETARLFTIEKPFIPSSSGGKAGEPFKSCISPGVYALSNFVRPGGDKVWILSNPDLDVFKLDTDIPPARRGKARFLILIHVGNRARDVVGCIAPGLSHRTDPDGMPMVTSSREAMKVLHKALDGRRHMEIQIINGVEPPRAPAAAALGPVGSGTANLHSWLRVPRGSKLVVRLSGTTTTTVVTGSGLIQPNNAPPRNFSDAEVQPGPLEVQLVGHDACAVLLNLQFGTQATASVSAFVVTPDGARVPGDYDREFARPQGSSETIVLNVVTV